MFLKAKPIWLKNLENEMNVQALFTARFKGRENVTLQITGATAFRVYLNGKLLHYGPARAAGGYARIDVVNVPDDMLCDENEVKIEAVNHYCNTYAFVRQTGYLQAEFIVGEKALAATGYDFDAFCVNAREQKVMRYSFQRGFSEVWDMSRPAKPHEICVPDIKIKYLDRHAPLPFLSKITLNAAAQVGDFTYIKNLPEQTSRQFMREINETFLGFGEKEIVETPIFLFDKIKYSFLNAPSALPSTLASGNFALFDFGRNISGMIGLKLRAAKKSKLLIAFDEKLVDGRFKHEDWSVLNVIQLSVDKDFDFTSFEVYGFRYAAVFVVEGEVAIDEFYATQYKNPIKDAPTLKCDDKELLDIYAAAVETARQNTVDIYMDCPTRERAGWLNDSYFSSQAEYAFTGKTRVEDDYIENCLLHTCPDIPKGMLPMCYPSDHFNGNFIPQCAMWFTLQIEQYKKRNPSFDIEFFKNTAYKLLKYFEKYENEYGLLENLPGWNFIEWSEANDWTDGVNFPTNMMYAETLCVIGRLFDDKLLIEKAEKIRGVIIDLSFDGTFFHDQAERNEKGTLITHPDRITEVCQYYAFRFKSATPETHPQLYNILLTDFYPNTDKYPEIPKINAIMGMYMRLELLYEWGEYEKAVDEIRAFFGHMAQSTGTLWEHKDMCHSLNHGLAAYAGAILLKIYNK